MLLSIHDLNLAARFATHALVLGPGGSWRQGPVDEAMEAAALSAAFGHALRRVQVDGRTVFVAA